MSRADTGAMSRHRPILLAPMGAAAILPGAALEGFASTPVAVGGTQHFAFVFIAAAFSTMTALLAVHGLATPGVLAGPNGVVALTGAASLPAGAAVLALTALPGLRHTRRMGPLLALQAVLAAGVLALGAAGLVLPGLVPAVPAAGTTAAIVLMVVAVALFGLLANRALRTFALTRRLTDLVVAVGCAWLALASVGTLTCVPGTLGFFLGHALELAGVLLLGVSAAVDLRRRRPAPARRRPAPGRDRRLRGGLPRRPRARAHAAPE